MLSEKWFWKMNNYYIKNLSFSLQISESQCNFIRNQQHDYAQSTHRPRQINVFILFKCISSLNCPQLPQSFYRKTVFRQILKNPIGIDKPFVFLRFYWNFARSVFSTLFKLSENLSRIGWIWVFDCPPLGNSLQTG